MGQYKYITIDDKLKGFSFLRLPRVILQDEELSLGAKILYALMLDRTDWVLRQKRKRNIDELKRAHIMYPYEEICKDLGITKKAAEEYIKNYFGKYPNVKKYLAKAVEDATQNGYA